MLGNRSVHVFWLDGPDRVYDVVTKTLYFDATLTLEFEDGHEVSLPLLHIREVLEYPLK